MVGVVGCCWLLLVVLLLVVYDCVWNKLALVVKGVASFKLGCMRNYGLIWCCSHSFFDHHRTVLYVVSSCFFLLLKSGESNGRSNN
jgi:hypothetical protein